MTELTDFTNCSLSQRNLEYGGRAGAGASCCESYDALSGLRTFDEMDEKFRSGWEDQNLLSLK